MKNNFNISVHCVTLPNHSMLVGACARRYTGYSEKIKKRFFTRESYPSEPSLSYSIPRRNTIVDFSHLTIDILAYKIQKRDTVELPFWGSAFFFLTVQYNCTIVIFLMLACYKQRTCSKQRWEFTSVWQRALLSVALKRWSTALINTTLFPINAVALIYICD